MKAENTLTVLAISLWELLSEPLLPISDSGRGRQRLFRRLHQAASRRLAAEEQKPPLPSLCSPSRCTPTGGRSPPEPSSSSAGIPFGSLVICPPILNFNHRLQGESDRFRGDHGGSVQVSAPHRRIQKYHPQTLLILFVFPSREERAMGGCNSSNLVKLSGNSMREYLPICVPLLNSSH